MKPSRRLRILDVLSRQTRLRVEQDKQQLRKAAAARDTCHLSYTEAQARADAALAVQHRLAEQGQTIDVELLRNGGSHVADRLRSAATAQLELERAQDEVKRKHDCVAKGRVRIEKLEDRRSEEVEHLKAVELERVQHELDEAWLLKQGGLER